MTDERRRTALVLLLGAAAVAVDQLTKTIAVDHLEAGEPVHVLWTLQLNLVYNRGGAFSIGTQLTPYIAAAASVILAVLLLSSRRAMSAPSAVGLGLVIGGAAGNLVDRLLRDNGGAVIDFFDLQWWPVFNVADICLSVGAVVLVVASIAEDRQRRSQQQAGLVGPDGAPVRDDAASTGGDGGWTR